VCLAAVGIVLVGTWTVPLDLAAEESPGAVEPPGDAIVPMPTMGGKQFWADELHFHRWRIQRNVLTDHCRLLDGHDRRHASGSFAACRAKLDQIKQRRKLPPVRGEVVIVLHGLFRTRSSMMELCEHLERHGGYTVLNVGYPSTRRDIYGHARALGTIIDNLPDAERISFVGFSMGNIVIRRYLRQQADEVDGATKPRIGRLVMIAPPNHGSHLADSLSGSGLFGAIAGKPGRQLGREWAWLESDLATPQFEFGIIAGGLQDGRGFSPLIPGDDDATVAVATTRLAGARDFVVLPARHTSLVSDPKVLEYTLRFLKQVYFISPQRRQSVSDE
jgi:pimeloyl-ACP methyl ester carboxylesterase